MIGQSSRRRGADRPYSQQVILSQAGSRQRERSRPSNNVTHNLIVTSHQRGKIGEGLLTGSSPSLTLRIGFESYSRNGEDKPGACHFFISSASYGNSLFDYSKTRAIGRHECRHTLTGQVEESRKLLNVKREMERHRLSSQG